MKPVLLLLLLLFSLLVRWTKGQDCHLSRSLCPLTCNLDTCCARTVQIGCYDSCNHTYSCSKVQFVSAQVMRCIFKVNGPLSTGINVTFVSTSTSTIDCSNYCNSSDNNTSSAIGLEPISCYVYTVSTYSPHITGSLYGATITPVSSVMETHLIASNTTSTPSTSGPVNITFTITRVIVPAVVGTALLCLVVVAIFGSILGLVLCKTKRKQFPVTNNSDQMSQQRMDNIYSAVQTADLSSTDGVYRTFDREETTTEIPHHLNTPALPTYSSLADVQQNTSNIENLPLNYDVVRLENVSGSKTGVIDPYNSLAEDVQQNTSNVKELPQNYDIVRLENMSENKTGVIDQDSAEVIRVQPAAVYSTVVRQNGKKMTVKLDTTITLVEEKNAE